MSVHQHVFKNDSSSTVDVDIFKGGVFLGCAFGAPALYIWGIGILAAGQSSTMTGTYAGQFAMEGFLNLKWKRWQRVLLTRSIAIAPTIGVAAFEGIDDLTGFNDALNVLMSMQLPFAVLPILAFTSNATIMKEFKNGLASMIAIGAFGVLIIAINVYFVAATISSHTNNIHWALIMLIVIALVAYFVFVIYLAVFCLVQMGCHFLENPYVQFVIQQDNFQLNSATELRDAIAS